MGFGGFFLGGCWLTNYLERIVFACGGVLGVKRLWIGRPDLDRQYLAFGDSAFTGSVRIASPLLSMETSGLEIDCEACSKLASLS